MQTTRTRHRTIVLAAATLTTATLTACLGTGAPASVPPQAHTVRTAPDQESSGASIERHQDGCSPKERVTALLRVGSGLDPRLHQRAE